MSFSLVYLIQRFFYRIYEFLRHWYAGGFLAVVHQTLNILESLDRSFAFRITLKNIFKPLYQDYSILGRILGFIFRSARAFFGGVIYLVIVLIAAAIYVGWAILPFYILYQGFRS